MTEEATKPEEFNLMMGIAGAAAGAIAVGLAYGAVGMFVAEYKWLALATGAASGVAAVRLAKGYSIPLGAAAAVLTLVGIIAGKMLIRPEGADWVAYHTTMFDILFCYVGAPAAAFVAAGTAAGGSIREHLPF